MIIEFKVTKGIVNIFNSCRIIGLKNTGEEVLIYGWSDVVITTKLDARECSNLDLDQVTFKIPRILKSVKEGTILTISDKEIKTIDFSYYGIEFEKLDLNKIEANFPEDIECDNKLILKCIASMNSFDKDTQNKVKIKGNKVILSNAVAAVIIDDCGFDVNTMISFTTLKSYLQNNKIEVKGKETIIVGKDNCYNLGEQSEYKITVKKPTKNKIDTCMLEGFNTELCKVIQDVVNCYISIHGNLLKPIITTTNITVGEEEESDYILKTTPTFISLIYSLFGKSDYIDLAYDDNVVSLSNGRVSLIFGGVVRGQVR